mmetsp:Transcript_33206/g.87288  ORF Transcript_33206/g.87288 Transcript_33206/m.87288 type:complete len:327 (+) Transcript_33206:43-1023(+)
MPVIYFTPVTCGDLSKLTRERSIALRPSHVRKSVIMLVTDKGHLPMAMSCMSAAGSQSIHSVSEPMWLARRWRLLAGEHMELALPRRDASVTSQRLHQRSQSSSRISPTYEVPPSESCMPKCISSHSCCLNASCTSAVWTRCMSAWAARFATRGGAPEPSNRISLGTSTRSRARWSFRARLPPDRTTSASTAASMTAVAGMTALGSMSSAVAPAVLLPGPPTPVLRTAEAPVPALVPAGIVGVKPPPGVCASAIAELNAASTAGVSSAIWQTATSLPSITVSRPIASIARLLSAGSRQRAIVERSSQTSRAPVVIPDIDSSSSRRS